MPETFTAKVTAAHGRRCVVTDGSRQLACIIRGRKKEVAVGDTVTVRETHGDQGVIEDVSPRKSLLYRSDAFKSKYLAANIDLILVVTATAPVLSAEFVSRATVAATASGTDMHIILNKSDLTEKLPDARERLSAFKAIGYPVHELSAETDPDGTKNTLLPLIKGKTVLLIGQSGTGKSTITNLLCPDANAAVREISDALNTGRHTTTGTRLYDIGPDTFLIDSPGFHEFGLYHVAPEDLPDAFTEFKPYLGKCRFADCKHLAEPDCAVLEAVEEGRIDPMRHALYRQLLSENTRKIW